jgi:two-component system phosphate regulon sensor histidine kinase PhoR
LEIDVFEISLSINVILTLILGILLLVIYRQNRRRLELVGERNLLNAILKGMYEGVIVVNRAGKVVLINDSMKKIFPIPPDYQNKTLLEVINNSRIHELFEEMNDGAEFLSKEVTVNEEGDFSLYANLSTISRTQKIDAIVGVFHNISKIRRLEKMRKYLIANISHELKTPLASIKGYAETLIDGAIDERETAIQFSKVIARNADFLTKLIEEMLQLSKLDTGEYQVQKNDIYLKSFVYEVIEGIPLSNYNRVTIVNDLENDVIPADVGGLKQVVSNLITNALKYSHPDGLLRIHGNKTVCDGERYYDLVFTDNGIGIPPEDLTRVFERFYRVEKARSREMGGTGLGLSIVKNIVAAHKGKVWVESVRGEGSKFFVRLPY